MKNTFLVLGFCISILVVSCTAPQKTSSTASTNPQSLSASWEMNYITGPRITFDGLFPNKKPVMTFDAAAKRVSGNASCNTFTGGYTVDAGKINFAEGMAVTRMMCPDMAGETLFLQTLKKINGWSVNNGNELNLYMGEILMMRFTKK